MNKKAAWAEMEVRGYQWGNELGGTAKEDKSFLQVAMENDKRIAALRNLRNKKSR